MSIKAVDTKQTDKSGLTKAQVADLKLRYGDDLLKIDTHDGPYVFKPPSRTEFSRYTSSLVKKREDLITPAETMALDCLVWPVNGDEPDQMRLRAVFDRRPALCLQIGRELQNLAGGTEESEPGKL